MENMRLNMLKEMLKGLSDEEKLELFKEASNLDLSLDTKEGHLVQTDDWDSYNIEPKLEGLNPDKEDSQAGNIDWDDLATIKPEQPSAFDGIPIRDDPPSSPPSSIMGFGSPKTRERQRTKSPIWTEENYLFGSDIRLMNIATEIYNSNQRTKLTTKKNQDPNIFRHISGRRLNRLQKYQLDMGYNKPDDLFAIRFCTKDPSLSKTSERFDVPLSELSIKRNVLDFTNYDYGRESKPRVKEIILKFEDSSNPNTTIGEFLTALNYMDFYHKALSLDMRHIKALINKSKNDRTDNKWAILNDRSLLLLDPSFKLETNVDIFINNLYAERRDEVHQHHLLFSGESETKDISKFMESYREKRERLDRAYLIYRERGTITLIHSLLPYGGYLEIEGNKVKVSPRFYEDCRSLDFQNDLYRKFLAKLEDNGIFMLS